MYQNYIDAIVNEINFANTKAVSSKNPVLKLVIVVKQHLQALWG